MFYFALFLFSILCLVLWRSHRRRMREQWEDQCLEGTVVLGNRLPYLLDSSRPTLTGYLSVPGKKSRRQRYFL